MESILLFGVAAFFFIMGAVALYRPERIVGYVGTSSLTRDGRNEVRAVYGGFGIAVAAILVASGELPALRPGIAVAVAVSVAGMAAGRVVSAVIDGSPGPYPWLFCAGEIILTVSLLASIP
jgi:hypothetical protein